ncbi:DUF4136 domain-containing protein [Lysobacter sp. KIS68-7]|uniref:DUF4136 domain-containing protein n=1 Tax=Lysobacter sp. KIS68-7 TaxID=2904252 RepID=UPI001E4D5FAC|nr:DUF4136 domain-containing protein [Lysobacter sp. KIS68-7]UHQ19343.1 DUF4136 domain-containing protein [Lysobacter sp. KIS68-7]
MHRTTLPAAFAALLLTACASSAPVVQTDHAQGVDFARYRTYTWVEEPHPQSPITHDKLIRAIDGQLAAKGLQRVPEGGDIALAGRLDTREDVSYHHFSVGLGVGGWGNNGGAGLGTSTGTSTPKTNLVGALVIDMYDAKTKQAIWRGTASGNAPTTPEKVDAALEATIPKLFATFPPK